MEKMKGQNIFFGESSILLAKSDRENALWGQRANRLTNVAQGLLYTGTEKAHLDRCASSISNQGEAEAYSSPMQLA